MSIGPKAALLKAAPCRFGSVAFLLALSVVAGGCLRPQAPSLVRYTLEPQLSVPAIAPTGLALAVRPIESSRAYGIKIAVRREGLVLDNYENAEWAESPERMVEQALRDALIQTGAFLDVARSSDIARPDASVTAELREFEVDATQSAWVAHVKLAVEVREAPGRVLWQRTLAESAVPLESNQVAALPAAMSEALAHAVEQAAETLARRAADWQTAGDGESPAQS